MYGSVYERSRGAKTPCEGQRKHMRAVRGGARSCGLPSWNHAARAAIMLATAALETPLRVQDPSYDRATGVWTLPLPTGSQLLRESSDARPASGIPTLPTGSSLQLMEKEAECVGVGGRVWRAAGALCRWQLQNSHLIRGAVRATAEGRLAHHILPFYPPSSCSEGPYPASLCRTASAGAGRRHWCVWAVRCWHRCIVSHHHRWRGGPRAGDRGQR